MGKKSNYNFGAHMYIIAWIFDLREGEYNYVGRILTEVKVKVVSVTCHHVIVTRGTVQVQLQRSLNVRTKWRKRRTSGSDILTHLEGVSGNPQHRILHGPQSQCSWQTEKWSSVSEIETRVFNPQPFVVLTEVIPFRCSCSALLMKVA